MINYKTHNILWNLNPRNLKIRSRWNYPPQHIVSKTLDPTIYCDLDLLNVGNCALVFGLENGILDHPHPNLPPSRGKELMVLSTTAF